MCRGYISLDTSFHITIRTKAVFVIRYHKLRERERDENFQNVKISSRKEDKKLRRETERRREKCTR